MGVTKKRRVKTKESEKEIYDKKCNCEISKVKESET